VSLTLPFDVICRRNCFLQIASVQTDFQMIDIYDVLTPERGTPESYEKSLASNGSYESAHPELFQPDRIIFLGGMLQSRRVGDAAYHEALVHPTLFAHPNPKRVAIIGGGEGATLREVLKHKTVEKVVMIEIDEMMVNVSRRFLPEWSDCSNLVGRSDNCFDDARVDLYFEDAFKWFKDRFLSADEPPEDPFDVIIMDVL
jgi:spermidine synthase